MVKVGVSSDVNKATGDQAKAKALVSKAKAKDCQICSRPGQGQGQTLQGQAKAKAMPNTVSRQNLDPSETGNVKLVTYPNCLLPLCFETNK